jgi:hypothetical protein
MRDEIACVSDLRRTRDPGPVARCEERKTSFGRIQNATKFDQNRTFRVAVAEDGHAPGFGQHALKMRPMR